MKKKLLDFINGRIATMEKNVNGLTDAAAKSAAQESLNQLYKFKAELNDLGEDNPESIEQLRKDVTDALARIDARMNEFASQIEALQERMGNESDSEPAANSVKATNYLKSAQATSDFLASMRGSKNDIEFKQAWGARLSANGITIADGSEDAYLPEAVRGAIQDAWEKPGNWLNQLTNTRAKSYFVRLNGSTQSDETSRAKGHQKGATKGVESLTFSAKKITAQMIYKIMPVDNMTIFEDDGSLLNYIANELVNQWQIEVQRAILVGDGRLDADPYKITSVEPIVSAGSTYTTTTTHSSSNELIDEVVGMVEDIKNDEGADITLFMSLSTLNSLRRIMLSSDSTPQYVGTNIVAEQLGVKNIITTSLLGSSYLAIAVRLDAYVTVGSITPSFVEWEDYITNVKNYRVEVPFGGALGKPLSAAVLASA